MDINELQRRCREIAGEADIRSDRRTKRLESLVEPHDDTARPWLSQAAYDAMMAEKSLAYYAHVSEYEGKPQSAYRIKPKKRK
jgi:hypothetical protein